MTSPRTLLGPLTTTWTPPPVCSYYMALCDTCTTAWAAQTCNQASKAHDWTDCWPPRASSMPDPGVMMGWGLYSPGLACPAGYSTAALATSGGQTGWGLEYAFVSAGETAAACCPTGFACSSIETLGTYAATCALTVSSASFSTVQCDAGSFNDFSLITLPYSISNTVLSTYVLLAPLIQLNWQPSDLPPTTSTTPPPAVTAGSSTTPASPGSTATSTAAGPTTTTSFPVDPMGNGTTSSSSTASSSSSSGSSSASGAGTGTGTGGTSTSGLPVGAKVGIGVGAGVGAILLAILAILLYRARRRRQQGRVVAEGEAARDKMWPVPSRAAELGGQEVQELEGSSSQAGGGAGGWKRRLSAGGPFFKVATPSAARGSGFHDAGDGAPPEGPFELEAPDSPAPRVLAEAEGDVLSRPLTARDGR